MRNWTIGAVAAALLMAGTPAHAGWRGAEWGMTLQQVKAAQPKATTMEWWGRKALKTGPVTYADWSWKSATYLFDKNGKLMEVELVATTEASRERLLPFLAAQFGAPVLSVDASTEYSKGVTTFRDDKRGNLITLEEMGSDVTLRFTPARITMF